MKRPSVLFIAPTRIGDAVLAASILRHIQSTMPEAEVTIATSPLAAPLYEGYPLLKRIIPVVKQRHNRHWLALWRETSGTRWDAVWDVRGSILSFVLRIRRRYYYVPPKEPAPKVKQYEKAFGTGVLPYPMLWPHPSDCEAAAQLLPEGTRYLILAPIANWEPKEWPLESFITLARLLLTGFCRGYRPVIICAAHERVRALPMLKALEEFHPVDLTHGSAPLLTIYAAMQRAHGFIGNDSGLMHMAAAANIPTLGVFGPTPHLIYQPWGEHADYVRAEDGDLSQLKPETVARAFRQLLDRT